MAREPGEDLTLELLAELRFLPTHPQKPYGLRYCRLCEVVKGQEGLGTNIPESFM